MMHWVIQENVCSEAKYDDLIHELEKADIPHTIVKVVPFSGDMIPEPNIPEGSKVWCMGSLSMQKYAKRKGWTPGVLDLDHAPWPRQKFVWGDLMLNNKGTVASFHELYHRKKACCGDENFVRPLDDSKFIKGQVMSKEEIFAWAKKIVELGDDSGADITKHTEILICPTNEFIQQEARFWIVDGQIATYSMYKLGEDITYSRALVDQDMITFVQSIIAPISLYHPRFKLGDEGYDWPAKAYCLDICRIEDLDELRIVEPNNINSSGLYDADVNKLVHAINNAFK